MKDREGSSSGQRKTSETMQPNNNERNQGRRKTKWDNPHSAVQHSDAGDLREMGLILGSGR